MKKARLFLVIFLVLSLISLHYLKAYFSKDAQKIENALKSLFPSTTPELMTREGKLWLIYIQENPETPAAYAFLTTDLAPEIKGYAGAIKALVGLKKNGHISGVTLISHNETPSYVYPLEEAAFTAQFTDKSISDNFEFGGDLDAITQATISTTAVYKSVKKSARLIAKEKFNLDLPVLEEAINWREFFTSSFPYIVSLIFLLALVSFYRPNTNFRYAIMILTIAYLGFYQKNFYSVFNLINILAGRFPAFTHISWYLLISLTFLVTLGWGRLYCGYICPFGAISEFIYLSNPFHLPLPPQYDKILREVKYYLMVLVVLIAIAASRLEIANFEPFKNTFSLTFISISGGLTILILFISLFNCRFWCKYFCLAGASLAWLSFLSLGGYRIEENCPECLLCGKNCYQKLDEPKKKAVCGEDDRLECIACGRCVETCSPQAIKTAFRLKRGGR